MHIKDKTNRTIFGDAAAAATLISISDTEKIFNFELGTDGKGKENLIVYNGGLRNRAETEPKEWKDDLGNFSSFIRFR